ncbi:MAG TPA: GGDEF domain-containing protein [Candidatus Acidoferrum sp.]|nr:GGDEF domain-containing protein [Candidatus Acidoferrum sp.]
MLQRLESGSERDDARDLLAAIAIGLAADTRDSSRRALGVIKARSPDLLSPYLSGEDLAETAVGFIDVLLASLHAESDLPWFLYDQRACDYGRLRAAQGVPLESLIDVLATLRRITVELISQPLEGSRHRDEVLALAQSRIEDVLDRLTSCMARGYLNHVGDEARTDHLTGLANRREFERVIDREVALAERHHRHLAMMLIDLDGLKRINDRQGHPAGDVALRSVGQQLQRVVRSSDVCGRLGGDEFGVVMPETNLARAHEVATRLQAAIRALGHGTRQTEPIEVSVGLAAWKPGRDWKAVYEAADNALYDDKRRHKKRKRAPIAGVSRSAPAPGL